MTTTNTEIIPDHTATVDAYLAWWNATDQERRAALTAEVWTEDAAYYDPMFEAAGHEALSDMAAGVQAQFPGQRFTRTSGVDEHHGLVRFGWELGDGAGTVTVAGIDIGIVARDGRLNRIAGFFGPLPEREAV